VADHRLVERFRTALDLWVTGVALQRQSIRRAHPEATEAEVEARVNRWLQERPGAETGDGPRATP
jgi:Rv0078B-related antitoxin